MARGGELQFRAWQWQQRLEQKKASFSRDSERTLGTFVVRFGRLFGTKLAVFWGGEGLWRGVESCSLGVGSGSSGWLIGLSA